MIIFVHLLNDRSGSPKVLLSALNAISAKSNCNQLFIGSDGAGVLDEANIKIKKYWYKRTHLRAATLITYTISQIHLVITLLRDRSIARDAIIYVNTLLPFGAAIYGRMTGRYVVYHLHEVSLSPAPLRWFLLTMVRLTAKRLIYVSDFHRNFLPIRGVPSYVVHNALDQAFIHKANNNNYKYRSMGQFNVLMLSYLRDYKGIPELLTLARRLTSRTDIHFNLVVNEDEDTFQHYLKVTSIPSNLTLYPRTNDPTTHYANASLVINLSRPDQCTETFGLTLLEAMSFGIPVIAPPAGGPLELVNNDSEGYLIDSREGDKLKDVILKLAGDESLCQRFSAAARIRASLFAQDAFEKKLLKILDPTQIEI
jgi:glycosyltransferase involved in cell wall biosynthesis